MVDIIQRIYHGNIWLGVVMLAIIGFVALWMKNNPYQEMSDNDKKFIRLFNNYHRKSWRFNIILIIIAALVLLFLCWTHLI